MNSVQNKVLLIIINPLHCCQIRALAKFGAGYKIYRTTGKTIAADISNVDTGDIVIKGKICFY